MSDMLQLVVISNQDVLSNKSDKPKLIGQRMAVLESAPLSRVPSTENLA